MESPHNKLVGHQGQCQVSELLLQRRTESRIIARCLPPAGEQACFYAFPMIPKVISKNKRDMAMIVLIAPCCPKHFCLTDLLQMSIQPPILDLMPQHHSKMLHLDPKSLYLINSVAVGWLSTTDRYCSLQE